MSDEMDIEESVEKGPEEQKKEFRVDLINVRRKFIRRQEILSDVFGREGEEAITMLADMSNYIRYIEDLSQLMQTDSDRLLKIYLNYLETSGGEENEEEDEYDPPWDPLTQSPMGGGSTVVDEAGSEFVVDDNAEDTPESEPDSDESVEDEEEPEVDPEEDPEEAPES